MESGKEIITNAFWREQGLSHIKPNTGQDFPEGFDVLGFLKEWVGDRKICEVGCGYGRLSPAFSHSQYAGYDINPKAIDKALDLFPLKLFYEGSKPLFDCDLVMVYTVLLHIPDESISDFIKMITEKTNNILVAEIMGRKWRRAGNPPVFNREPEDYDKIFSDLGFGPVKRAAVPYLRYPNTDITFIEYERH